MRGLLACGGQRLPDMEVQRDFGQINMDIEYFHLSLYRDVLSGITDLLLIRVFTFCGCIFVTFDTVELTDFLSERIFTFIYFHFW